MFKKIILNLRILKNILTANSESQGKVWKKLSDAI